MIPSINAELAERCRLFGLLSADNGLKATIAEIAAAVVLALRRGNKVLLCGNGGSAADAQHLSAEFVSRFRYDRPGLPAIAITTDTSALTAIGNDYGFDRLFARQIEALARPGDILLAFSTSGRSPNVLAGLEAARRCEVATAGFTGEAGGAMGPLCDLLFRAPSADTAHIQELHMTAGHIICGLAEAEIFPQMKLQAPK